VALVLVGLMAAELAIWVGGKFKAADASTQCPTIPLNISAGAVTKYRFEKSLWSRWHWRYTGKDGIDGKFEQRCPSLAHDAELSIGGKVAGRTDGKLLTTVSKTYVLDCRGDRAFEWDTGDAFQALINTFQINARYVIRKNGTVVAYVSSTNFLDTTIVIRDAFKDPNSGNNEVANLYRKKFTTSAWNWEFTIYNATHPASDALLLTMLAGQRSFSENRKETDTCNQFFKGVGFFLVAILCLTFVLLVGGGYRFVKKNGRLPKFSDVKGSTTSKKDGGMEEPGISLNPTVAT